MYIAVIDADLITRSKQRFPNLACMKISGYYKSQGNQVVLKTDYKNIEQFDKVFISKVFTDTKINEDILYLQNVEYGGTGFFYDKAPPLPYEIEHHMPDYDLYSEWVQSRIENSTDKKKEIKSLRFFTNYSIGFTTRGCFRQCYFCVNKNCTQSILHSPVEEFLNLDKPYILLLDDNMFACKDWKQILESLNKIKKPFQYKQGLDERLMTKEKADLLFCKSKYHEDFIFAFDNILDKELIENKLKLIREVYPNKSQNIKFYVFCGSRNPDRKYNDFHVDDIVETFERIKILSKYNCFPYIMRHADYINSIYSGIYSNLAAWCNQPHIFKKMSFREFCTERGMKYEVYKQYKGNYEQYLKDGYKKGSTWRYMDEFEKQNPEIAKQYFDMKFEKLNIY